jgi:hypothetical protein
MGLQARTERLKPKGFGSLDSSGIGIAATGAGGYDMADQSRFENDPTLIGNSRPRGKDENVESEPERVRGYEDRDRQVEREEVESEDDRGYDEAVRGSSGEDVDPDSPDWDGDRDDTGNA